MTTRASSLVFRQFSRLFELGAVGNKTDAELLDCFLRRREEAAEAAFEELMNRHGPMVFRVCRGLLRDHHDAEDAFQAVFLILAHRASSVRRHGSIASWLFGVAHRVASRARSRAVTRRARDERAAARSAESYQEDEELPWWTALHEEIDRLPAALRASVVLCYLEGLTYEGAARQLGVSEGTIRGRLVRARERLRRRLIVRAIVQPVGLLAASVTDGAQAAIPASLARSTVRIALGFKTGENAWTLARAVLNSMLLHQLKVATVLLLIGVGGSFFGWSAVAELFDDKGSNHAGQANATTSAPALPPLAPAVRHRLIGTVLVEGTGKAVARAKLRIRAGEAASPGGPTEWVVESGEHGCFAVELPVGPIAVEISEPPVGYYWFRRGPGWAESFVMTPEVQEVQRKYHLREGTVWDFQFVRGDKREPVGGYVSGSDRGSREAFEAQADDSGRLHFTLPSGRCDLSLELRESSPRAPQLETGFFAVRLTSDAEFLPAEM